MTSILKNVAGQRLPYALIASADGEAPVTAGTPSVFVKTDGGAMAAGAGTVGAQDAGGGGEYLPTQAETNGDALAFRVTLAGAITERFVIYTEKPQTVYYDATAGAGGSGLYNSPINDPADALARLNDWGARHLVILQGGFTVPAATGDISRLTIDGAGLDTKVSLNNRPATDTLIRNAVVDGQLASGELILDNCLIDGILDFLGYARFCLVNGNVTVAANGPGFFSNCAPQYANSPPIINYQGLAINAAGITEWVGPITVDGIGLSSFVTNINIAGQLTFGAGCANNAVAVTVTGQGTITDNSGANFTFDRSQFLEVTGGNAYADQRLWAGAAPGNTPDAALAAYSPGTGPWGGFSTHSAADVWTSPTRTVTGGTIDTNNDMRGTDGVDTAPMRGTDGASTHAPADVWGGAAPTRQLTSPQAYDNTGQTTPLPTTVAGTVDANLVSMLGNGASVEGLSRSTQTIAYGAVGAGSTTTAVVYSATTPTHVDDDQWSGKVISFYSGSTGLLTQSARVADTGSSASTNTIALAGTTPLTRAPASGDLWVIT